MIRISSGFFRFYTAVYYVYGVFFEWLHLL